MGLNQDPLNLRKDLRVGSFNTRTLKASWRLEEACFLASKREIDILCIQEHRIRVPASAETTPHQRSLEGGWLFCHASARQDLAHGGVGVLLSPKLAPLLEGLPVVISERIMQLKLRANPGSELHVICCYAPTAGADDAKKEEFYGKLDTLLDDIPPDKTFIVCGDFNATLVERITHVNCLPGDAPNDNTEIFTEFLLRRGLRPANFYQQPRRNAKLHTFTSHNGTRQVCLDYVLVPTRWIRSIRSSSVLHRTGLVPSDHRPIVTNLRLRIRRPRHTPSPFDLYDWSRLSDTSTHELLTQAVSAHLACPDLTADADPSGFGRLKNALQAAAAEVIPRQPRTAVTPIRALPSIHAGRSLSAMLNQPAQTMAPLYQEEVTRRLAALSQEVEQSFQGNQQALAYKKIAQIAGTSHRRQPGLSGTPSENNRSWAQHFTHLFRQEDIPTNPPSGSDSLIVSDQEEGTFTGTHGGDRLQITRPTERRGRLSSGEMAQSLLGRFDVTIPGEPADVDNNASSHVHSHQFMQEELDAALEASKATSPGLDGLPYEVYKLPEVRPLLLAICNHVLLSGAPPSDWLNAGLVPLFKKGDTNVPANYRGIALMPTAAKLFNKMILHRIRVLVDSKLSDSQNGFRPHRSCPQHILALRLLVENCALYKEQSAVLTFLDFKKAFDSVHRSYLLDTLVEFGVPEYLITAVMSLYRGSTVQVVTKDGLTDKIHVDRGVLQGDTLAPYLFIMVMDRVLKRARIDPAWGYHVRGRRSSRDATVITVTELAFADDITLVANTFAHAARMLHAIAASGREAGLEINVEKTKVLVLGDLAVAHPTETLSLDGVPIERVENFLYLGSLILNTTDEIRRCIRRASHQTGVLQNVWKLPLQRTTKARFFRAFIDPILFYASETWITTQADLALIRKARNRLLRLALGIRWNHFVTNQYLHVLASTADVIIEKRRLSFLGHVARFPLYPNMAQPVLRLLWHVPHRTTMRRGQGNRTTYLGQLRACLGIDNNAELREIVDLSPAVEFNKWTTSRCSARWNHWGVRPPRGPAQNIAEVFSPAEGSPLPPLYELFGTPSEDPHPTT